MEFETNVDLEVINGPEIRPQKVCVNWNLEFEMGSYGIKDTFILIPTQKITYTGYYNDKNDDEIEQEHTETLTSGDVAVDVKWNPQYGSLMPTCLTLGYADGKLDYAELS